MLKQPRFHVHRETKRSAEKVLITSLLMLFVTPSFATHITCVNNASDFRTELQKAGESGINNDADNQINLAVGIYPINNTIFQYGSAKTFTLDITGGYNSDCSQQVTRNPIYTVLSGVGSSKLILESNSMGDVSIRFVTFKGGNVTSGGSALWMNAGGSTGQVILDYDIFTANSGGNVVYIGGSTLVQLNGNLFFGNVSAEAAFSTLSTAQFFATNNTFTQNAVAAGGDSVVSIITAAQLSTAAVSNNIFYNNTFTNAHGSVDYSTDLEGQTNATVQLEKNMNNSVRLLSANAATNTDIPGTIDPQFASSNDFHLKATSPGIAAGTLTPPGGLPSIDIEGNPRTFHGTVDVGAYERGDEIFKDGFGF